MRVPEILAEVERYYSEKVRLHGTTPQGVDWNSPESQSLRFEQLLKVCGDQRTFSLTDYGCGYGALLDHLGSRGFSVRYAGFDISPEMVARARALHAGAPGCEFFAEESALAPADYAVASGIFNVRLGVPEDEWREYVLGTLDRLAAIGRKGFSFNLLSLYSDPEKRRADLYYADPLALFDHCKRHFSPSVALLHDYPLYEFTMLVRL